MANGSVTKCGGVDDSVLPSRLLWPSLAQDWTKLKVSVTAV